MFQGRWKNGLPISTVYIKRINGISNTHAKTIPITPY